MHFTGSRTFQVGFRVTIITKMVNKYYRQIANNNHYLYTTSFTFD